ncbi:hypothetical protein IAU60_003756 [Kwoniella sp. DSM 27419]
MVAATTLLPVLLALGAANASPILSERKVTPKPPVNNDALYLSQAQQGVGSVPSGWSAQGCYNDGFSWSALSKASTSSFGMTYGMCTSFCSSRGYSLAGVESTNCYCANALDSRAHIQSYDKCNYICPGNWNQDCGLWGFYINVFKKDAVAPTPSPPVQTPTSTVTPAGPTTTSTVDEPTSTSTVDEPTSTSTSTVDEPTSTATVDEPTTTVTVDEPTSTSTVDEPTSTVTPDVPTDTASDSATDTATSTSSAEPEQPTEPAEPQPTEPVVVSPFPAGWAANSACIAEVAGRALTGSHFSGSDVTQASCASFCNDNGFTIAGVEYGSECWCGNILTNGASLTLTSQACTMQCAGDNTAICGGGNALNLIVSQAAVAALSPDLTSKTVELNAGWSVASTACVAEGTSGRALASASWADSSMTVGKCLSFCQDKGWQYAGVEYGRECYCGDSLQNGASLDRSSDSCNMVCAGDNTQRCGGGNGLQLYNNPSLALDLTVSNTDFAYQGCVVEVGGRALQGASKFGDDMSVDVCTEFCGASGFKYAGVEYGRECYCGNEFSNGASALDLSTQCTMTCASGTGICGGPNAISLYASKSYVAPTPATPVEQTPPATTEDEDDEPTLAIPEPNPPQVEGQGEDGELIEEL